MKNNLLRIKRMLERKCFASDDGSEYDVEAYINVVKAIDNELAANYIQEYINKAREYYDANKISYDEIQLYPRFSLYFDSKYAERYPYTIEQNVVPIPQIIRVYINGVGYENNGKKGTIDPDEVVGNAEFVVTFDDFKAILESNGLILEYNSFEDILKDYRNYKPTVCKISKSKTKIKKYIKD
jgi:hypothetical protein